MQVIEVDHVGLQALERILAIALDTGRLAVDDALTVDAGHAALADQGDLVAHRLQERPDQFLIAAETVEAGGVEMVDAQIQRLLQQRVALLQRRRRAVGVAEIHAAEADLGDVEWS